ncbi:hypothetical protein BGY98DRAFT_1179673 [Russula aff. rugulosa BPL654]|nr:hypothetical protein BGY98DRAFT_1179673 [Russula aff. rugulosa BPL654]
MRARETVLRVGLGKRRRVDLPAWGRKVAVQQRTGAMAHGTAVGRAAIAGLPTSARRLDRISTGWYTELSSILVYTSARFLSDNGSYTKYRKNDQQDVIQWVRPFTGSPVIASPSQDGYIGRKRPIFIARWASNSDSVDTPSKGDISESPTVRDVSVPRSPTSIAANICFGRAHFVMDVTLFVIGYECSEDRRRLGIKARFNGPTAIWELKSDPIELQLQHPVDSEPSVLAGDNRHFSDEDIGPQPRLSFSAPHSRFKCRALVLP